MDRAGVLIDLGVGVPYERAWDLQRSLVDRRATGAIPDTLLLCEHAPVITVGRGTKDPLPAEGPFPVFVIERGGAATYHGPGQLTGYPILALTEDRRDLRRYLRDLEETLIRALADLGVAAERSAPHTGVWSRGKKVASIGVAVRKWVTYHGFALNVSMDLEPFHAFRPCGMDGSSMSSLEAVERRRFEMPAVRAAVARGFREIFGIRLEVADRSTLPSTPS